MNSQDQLELTPTALEHAQNPRNYGPPGSFNGHARITGPCGDTMEFWLQIRHNRVLKASFITDGCAPSLACGSVATCLLDGKSLSDARALRQQDILGALGGLPDEVAHCALLAADTLRAACEDYNRDKPTEAQPTAGATCESCNDSSSSPQQPRPGESEKDFEDRRKLAARLCRIRHRIVVLSGKGGVGKSMLAVNLAVALKLAGRQVGLLDVDIHGPSVPTMLGLEGTNVHGADGEMIPVDLGGLKVLSTGFFLRSQDDAVVWRGPLKMGVIKQFLQDVAWGDLDFLIVDSPPGTGDEPLSVCQLLGKMDGAIIVTTPQKVAAVDVRKSISFCRQVGVPVLGVVENMSGFACPHCGEITHILRTGGGRRIAEDMNVPFLGSIPIDPMIAATGDEGEVLVEHQPDSATARILREIIRPILALDGADELEGSGVDSEKKEERTMRIAIPLADGMLAMHFGHCEKFALLDVDMTKKEIVKRDDVEAPPHQPGLLPNWLAQRGAHVIIAGGMGQRALGLFSQQGIRVMVGARAETPERLVQNFLAGALQLGDNVCDH
ncbi:MAG: iron-sulfur cluster carrier protein MrpORP [Acidobacteriota bacterium]